MRVLICVTHLLGTGHLARALTLARAFAEDGHQVAVASGGLPVSHFDTAGIEKMVEAFHPTRHEMVWFRYREDGWHTASREDCADATWFDIHTADGYDPDFAASARAVCCLDLVK